MVTTDAVPGVLTTAQARAAGVSRLLRDGTYARVARGLWLVVGADPEDPDTRIRLATAGVPGDVVVGGWAAARLHEATRLRRGRPAQVDGRSGIPSRAEPVLVLVPPETRLVDRPFRRLLRTRVPARDRAEVAGVAVTAPDRTAVDVARLCPLSLAVPVLDRLRALGLVSAGSVAAALDRCGPLPGLHRARRALAFSVDGAESPQESAMRLLWCEAGLPVPESNAEILDGTGRFVARVDVLDTEAGLVGEYDGAVHASAGSRSADATRQQRLEQLGLVVVRATSVDLATPAARAAWCVRLREAHRRARAQPTGATWRRR